MGGDRRPWAPNLLFGYGKIRNEARIKPQENKTSMQEQMWLLTWRAQLKCGQQTIPVYKYGRTRDPYSRSSGRHRRLQSATDDWGNSRSRPLDDWSFAQPQIFLKILILFYHVHFTCVWAHLIHLKLKENNPGNNTQLFVCTGILSLDAIFDSAVLSMKWSQGQFSCC